MDQGPHRGDPGAFSSEAIPETYFDPAFGQIVRRVRQGGCVVTHGPDVLTTVLGSCVAVCLRDDLTGIGGMTHFLMPDPSQHERLSVLQGGHGGGAPSDGGADAGSIAPSSCYGPYPYGEDAIHALIRAIGDEGGNRTPELRAKVFGGADVVAALSAIGDRNVRCAFDVLAAVGIPVVAHDVGGDLSRRIYFSPQAGRVWVRKKHPEEIDLPPSPSAPPSDIWSLSPEPFSGVSDPLKRGKRSELRR